MVLEATRASVDTRRIDDADTIAVFAAKPHDSMSIREIDGVSSQ